MKGKLYPLANYGKLGNVPTRFIKAELTGEKRPPKAGEWYISGAIPEAYLAPNDLSTPFDIAALVDGRESGPLKETEDMLISLLSQHKSGQYSILTKCIDNVREVRRELSQKG